MLEMKRMALLVLILAVVGSFSSPVHASSPVITSSTVSMVNIFSKYFPFFMRTLTGQNGTSLLPSEKSADTPVVGGDPDDYANGRGADQDGDGIIDLFGPLDQEKHVAK
jgi:hypothetical protein